MSQNKTVIQGLDGNDTHSASYDSSFQGGDFYQRGSNSKKGTVISGMFESGTPSAAAPIEPAQGSTRTAGATFSSEKPIVGFLYSVSRTAAGEYWPLHIGKNTIGQDLDCDIVLPEGTVSQKHAVLMVRKNKNPEKVIASVTDASSSNGSMLNGVSLEFEPVACKNGDILTVGDNYELLIILIDAPTLGLKVSPSFIHVKQEDPEDDFPFDPYSADNGATRPGGLPSTNPQVGGPQNYGGTVGYDGMQTSYNSGGTVGL